MGSLKTFTISDLAKAHEETAEQAYRRGYCDGWVVALDTIHDMLFQWRLSRQKAYDFLWMYGMYGKLHDWKVASWSDDKEVLPPYPSAKEALAWLEEHKDEE